MTKALKALAVIGSGIAALAASQALAAGLGASSQSLGSGQQTVSACTSDTLRVSYTTAYSPAPGGGGYGVTGVTVTDTATTPSLAACAGQTYRVTLLGASGASLAEVTGVVPGGATSFAATSFASPVDVAAVTGVALVLGG
ncbi:MAG: hypothetical protein WB802_14130 [Candidatus Dormiibacterota bacterium]